MTGSSSGLSFEAELILLADKKAKVLVKPLRGDNYFSIDYSRRELLLDFYKEAEKLKVEYAR